MIHIRKAPILELSICSLVLASGFAALSWELLWQVKSALALGLSDWGAALSLIVIMGGMSLGGFLMGQVLHNCSSKQALCLYGLLEVMIGLAGLSLTSTFQSLERLDTWAYSILPVRASLIYLVCMISVLAIPAICMGASFPLFGLIARPLQLSLAKLYSLNIIGAAMGVLFAALILIPCLGLRHTIWTISTINLTVGIASCLLALAYRTTSKEAQIEGIVQQAISKEELIVVFVSGFATFTLEIAWFRSLASTFENTTDNFAIMLACMLIALALAAKNISKFKQSKKTLSTALTVAGILILLTTPLIERFDTFLMLPSQFALKYAGTHSASTALTVNMSGLLNPATLAANSVATVSYLFKIFILFSLSCLVIIPPMRLLAMAFPWIIDHHQHPHSLGKLYAVNTLSSVLGALAATWLLLPTLGFAKTAWLAGGLVLITGIWLTSGFMRMLWATLGIIAMLSAVHFETGIGKTRAQGFYANPEGKPAKVLESIEGPQTTTTVIEYQDGARALLINSSSAAGEAGQIERPSIHYMAWMGHLPMLLHPNPKNALVICFGTGQTANAVEKENPETIDIVDISPQVFQLAHHFRSNEGILNNPKVKAITMDGRAYLRRSKKVYDIITLEPMPPISTGANTLYSREFYELARKSLGAEGVIAQWLPFQTAPYYSASIARTFLSVFPNAILWIDPASKNGILLGTKAEPPIQSTNWPGFGRRIIQRNLSLAQVQENLALDTKELTEYAKHGEIISDDNQLLAYGKALYTNSGLEEENFKLLHSINNKIPL